VLPIISKVIFWMAALRLLSGSIEILAGLLILKMNAIDKALIINSSLALVGPIIFLTTTTIGLVGIAGKISLWKIFIILTGIAMILIGVRSK
jgi:hypothetical protein